MAEKAETNIVVAGVDIGSTTSKVVILRGEQILGAVLSKSQANPARGAEQVFAQALRAAGLEGRQAVASVVGTGYGRALVPFADENISEISCHGRGAHHLLPAVRTIVDIGGQDTKAILVDDAGRLVDFVTNDRCAAGTGKFLEAMARTLDLELSDLSRLHDEAGSPCTITNLCSVFAESEVIGLIADGVAVARIVKGLHVSMANRVATFVRRLGIQPDVVVTGGVGKNRGVLTTLQSKLNIRLAAFSDGTDPQLVGALGAALFARDRCEGRR